jgi:hypothetical protein
LEGSAGSLSDLVQLILQGIELPFHFLERGAFGRDEQKPVLASDGWVHLKENP